MADGITTTHIYYDTIFETDIEGKRKKVTDARELEISYQYDMRPIQEDEEGNSDGGTVIQSESPDSGLKIQLPCVDGQPLFAVDAVGNHFLYDYDALRRPLRIKTKINGAASYITTALYEYGEELTNPEQDNLRGQLYRMYDASGLSQNNVFDFKGNLLSSQKQLLEDATLSEVDWEGSPSPMLSIEVFESSMTYDALNRLFTQTDPGGNTTENTYDEGGALKTVKLNGANYVQDIHYNEKGQRQAIWYGNGTKTSYTYDEFTFRLRRLLTVKLNTNDILQDLNYWYDPVGNITEIQDDAQQTLFFNNSVVSPTQKFVYDALYRLIEAKGRELISNADFGAEDNWNDSAWKTSYKGDGSAVQNYTQNYTYDEVGNILELQHIAGVGSYTRMYDIDTASNRLLSTTVGANTYNYPYDTRGNMTEMPHLSEMNWNTQNELSSIMKGSEPTYYQYSNGERVRKFTDKGIIKEERIYLGNFEIYRKFESGSLKIERQTVHVNDDTGRIAMLEKRTAGSAADDNGTAESLERYIYSNHLQSASLELDETGAIISYEEYHSYGTTSYQAINASINAVAKRYRYTGKERDEESGLYYHGARYYVPWLARWSAVDAKESEYTPWSPYHYVKCNPINDTDSTGMGGDKDNWRDEKFNPAGQSGTAPDGSKTVIPDNAIPLMNDKGQIEGYIGYGNTLFRYVNEDKQKGYVDPKGLHEWYYMQDYLTYQEYDGGWQYHLWTFLNTVGSDTLQMLGNPKGWAKDIWQSISNIDIGQTWDAIMSMDNYGKKALATSVIFGMVTSNPKRALWTIGDQASNAANALHHWNLHKLEFPHLQNAVQYAKAAKDFLDNIPKGALIKVTKKGEIRIWDKKNNIFGSYTPEGTPKTYFKLNPKSTQNPRGHKYPTNQEYWDVQPGTQFIH